MELKAYICPQCGAALEVDSLTVSMVKCPNCGNTDQNTMNIARRTCGYIGTNYWNQGRTQEIKERVLHIDNKVEKRTCKKDCK